MCYARRTQRVRVLPDAATQLAVNIGNDEYGVAEFFIFNARVFSEGRKFFEP
jgi:hypothetical protein